MVVQTKPCRNAGELENPMQIRERNGETVERTHTCLSSHTPEHEYFDLTGSGLCPFEDTCPHYEPLD